LQQSQKLVIKSNILMKFADMHTVANVSLAQF